MHNILLRDHANLFYVFSAIKFIVARRKRKSLLKERINSYHFQVLCHKSTRHYHKTLIVFQMQLSRCQILHTEVNSWREETKTEEKWSTIHLFRFVFQHSVVISTAHDCIRKLQQHFFSRYCSVKPRLRAQLDDIGKYISQIVTQTAIWWTFDEISPVL